MTYFAGIMMNVVEIRSRVNKIPSPPFGGDPKRLASFNEEGERDSIDNPFMIEAIQKAPEDLLYLLDIVERQAREIDRLKEENRWIPVTERLPDKKGVYQWWDRASNIYHPIYSCYFNPGKPKNWYGTATHWRPLPKGPEE